MRWLDGITEAVNMNDVGKRMSLPFNMLSRLIITFLPRSKRLLISLLQSLSTVILEPKKIKSVTSNLCSIFSFILQLFQPSQETVTTEN